MMIVQELIFPLLLSELIFDKPFFRYSSSKLKRKNKMSVLEKEEKLILRLSP